MDVFFQFTGFAKQQQKFLDIIHGLTTRVIRKRKAEFHDKVDSPMMASIMKELKKDSNTIEKDVEAMDDTKMRYVRDDLDEIDENDVGESIESFINY